jgi:hypothetical protein
MKLAKLVGCMAIFGAMTAYAAWTPTTATCTQYTACYNGSQMIRTGSQTWCVSGGTTSCTLTQCTYGPWTKRSC